MVPMTNLNDLAFLNSDIWRDRVRIVALNLDESKKGGQKWLTEKNWMSMEHYHIANKQKCNASKLYSSSTGIPHMMLVDKSGKIVYTGHP
jgi:hypothetical protein